MGMNIVILPAETFNTGSTATKSTIIEIDSETEIGVFTDPRTGNAAGAVIGLEGSHNGTSWYPTFDSGGTAVKLPALLNTPCSYSFSNIAYPYIRFSVITAVTSTDITLCVSGK